MYFDSINGEEIINMLKTPILLIYMLCKVICDIDSFIGEVYLLD